MDDIGNAALMAKASLKMIDRATRGTIGNQPKWLELEIVGEELVHSIERMQRIKD